MPTYQYVCTACSEPLEAVQSFTDAPLTECPACGEALRKVFSAVGVVFKGSGFYKNDSRKAASDGAKNKADAGNDSGKTETAAKDTSPATKPDSSSTSKPATPASTPTTSSKPAAKSA